MKYCPDERRQDRIRSASIAIEAIRSLSIEIEHKRELLSICLWKITEADGKWNLRYRSEGAQYLSGNEGLRHEHVFTRKHLIDRLLSGEGLESVLADAIACVVTATEAKVLDRVSDEFQGWDRYRKAGIRVLDLVTGDRIA